MTVGNGQHIPRPAPPHPQYHFPPSLPYASLPGVPTFPLADSAYSTCWAEEYSLADVQGLWNPLEAHMNDSGVAMTCYFCVVGNGTCDIHVCSTSLCSLQALLIIPIPASGIADFLMVASSRPTSQSSFFAHSNHFNSDLFSLVSYSTITRYCFRWYIRASLSYVEPTLIPEGQSKVLYSTLISCVQSTASLCFSKKLHYEY